MDQGTLDHRDPRGDLACDHLPLRVIPVQNNLLVPILLDQIAVDDDGRMGRIKRDRDERGLDGLPPVPGAVPIDVPTGQGEAVAGAALYERYGCINCHGPNGLGGVPNPQAPDKAIPPLSGSGFRHDFGTDQKITEMVRTGSVLGRAPIVSMPHWGGIISNAELKALVAYLKTLK